MVYAVVVCLCVCVTQKLFVVFRNNVFLIADSHLCYSCDETMIEYIHVVCVPFQLLV